MDTDFVHLFTMTTKAMKIVKTAILQEHGVYLGQDHMLELLYQSGGLTPREIATKLGHAVPTVVKMTQRMESTGLVTREPDEHDRRLVRISLTEHGRRLQEQLTKELAELESQTVAGLSADDLAALEHGLTLVLHNMRAARAGLAGMP
ncbi:MAG TPA: MarR family transcriptional regulator [Pseudonocardiaceae bacterium]|nr:MarR family transcriptional regulator [Pseudonocardiaceae bacterium]